MTPEDSPYWKELQKTELERKRKEAEQNLHKESQAEFEFWRWITESSNILTKVGLTQSFECRGVIALCDIEEDDLIVEIPQTLVVSENVAMNTPSLVNLVKELKNNSPEDSWLPLIYYLIWGRHKERDTDEEFFFRPYFAVLPKSYENPCFWTTEELAELEGTDLEPIAKSNKKRMKLAFLEVVLPILRRFPEAFDYTQISDEDFMWAVNTVWSRGYWMDDEDKIPCIIPLADMLNHKGGTDPVADYKYYSQTNTFRIAVTKPNGYRKGEEVFTTYGNKSNIDFLNDYGFVYTENTYNSFKFPTYFTAGILYETEILEFLDSKDYQIENLVYSKQEQFSKIAPAIRSTLISKNLQNFKPELIELCLQEEMINFFVELKICKMIKKILEKKLSFHPITLQEDETFFEKNKNNLSWKKYVAVLYRKDEKKLITEAMNEIESYKKNLLRNKAKPKERFKNLQKDVLITEGSIRFYYNIKYYLKLKITRRTFLSVQEIDFRNHQNF